MMQFFIQREVIFWDFDGVIKESVNCKADAYESLFFSYGENVSKRVREHHELNGGMSRYEKFPIYLKWAGLVPTSFLINDFCSRFSKIVFKRVVDSPVVPDVIKYLENNYSRQYFVLLTATPQEEIEEILNVLSLKHYFKEVYGAPTLKGGAMVDVLCRLKKSHSKALMVGDSEVDYLAAIGNDIPFILRRTPANLRLQEKYSGPSFMSLNI